jgi:hypothetical protein
MSPATTPLDPYQNFEGKTLLKVSGRGESKYHGRYAERKNRITMVKAAACELLGIQPRRSQSISKGLEFQQVDVQPRLPTVSRRHREARHQVRVYGYQIKRSDGLQKN